MLTRRDAKSVQFGGYSSLHDVRVTSLMSGEPFLDDGLVSYFDGQIATIVGYPLKDQPDPTPETLRNAAARWVEERGANGIVYIAPAPLNLRFLSQYGMRRTILQPRRQVSEELALRPLSTNGVTQTHAYRRFRRLPFECRVRRGGTPRATDLALFEAFYRRHDIDSYLADLAFAIPALLSAPWIFIIEARARRKVTGILLFHRPFDDCIVAVASARCLDTRGVSDFLLGVLIETARDMNIETINLGPSPSKGHYQFKRKWGAVPYVPPYYLVEWTRGSLSRRYYTGWGPRIIGLSP